MKFAKTILLFISIFLFSCDNRKVTYFEDEHANDIYIPGIGYVDKNFMNQNLFSDSKVVPLTLIEHSKDWDTSKIKVKANFIGENGQGSLYFRFAYKSFKKKFDKKCNLKIKNPEELLTLFDFELLLNGKVIRAADEQCAFYSIDTSDYPAMDAFALENEMSFTNSVFNLKQKEYFILEFPMNVFSELKAGEYDFELRITQKNYDSPTDYSLKRSGRSETTGKDTTTYACACIGEPFLNASYQFKITVPTLYAFEIKGVYFELKNDINHKWAGVFEEVPKLYYEINYRAKTLYSSPFERSLEFKSNLSHAFYVYHPEDKIYIYIKDFDYLSDPDNLDQFIHQVNQLPLIDASTARNKNIKSISIDARDKGIINN